MSIINIIKKNAFTALIVLAYTFLFIFKQNLAITSVKNSGYYLIEMLQIMPVIFVLTALLDTWIPKEIIMKYLGEGAKLKGVFLSFVMGSISAGPIYSAFPICIMLLNKGASIRNIVIILSSWAVIKLPMLLNEVKFLGLKFMIVRWILTVLAILVFSCITGKIVKKEEMPTIKQKEKGIYVSREYCMGCSLCCRMYPELFEMDNKKARLNNITNIDYEKLQEVCKSCPVKAIENT